MILLLALFRNLDGLLWPILTCKQLPFLPNVTHSGRQRSCEQEENRPFPPYSRPRLPFAQSIIGWNERRTDTITNAHSQQIQITGDWSIFHHGSKVFIAPCSRKVIWIQFTECAHQRERRHTTSGRSLLFRRILSACCWTRLKLYDWYGEVMSDSNVRRR